MACLCAPTSHEGSFRCRLHRSAPNPLSNPAHSSLNHPIRALNPSTNCCNVLSSQICSTTVRESSSPGVVSRAPPPFDDRIRPAQAAADLQTILRACPSSSSPSDSSSSLSSSAASPWSSTSPKSPPYRLSSSSSSCFPLTPQLQTPSPSSSSSSRSSASSSSSSPSPSSPYCCTRPPPAKRPLPSYSSLPKSSFRMSASPTAPSVPGCGASSSTTQSASHAAALAIMKQHSHNKLGARVYNRNTLNPASAFKIGPSRLSRMALASADHELPLLKEERCVSNSRQQHDITPDTFPGSFADSPNTSGFSPFRATQIGLKTRSAAHKFKQSESLCRIVGSKEGSLIMPTVY